MASIELDIWRGEWGLASIDLECLKVLVSTFENNLKQYLVPVYYHDLLLLSP